MSSRLCLLFALLAGIFPLWGQDDGVVKMTPEFPFTFPLTKSGNDVTVKYPVLINPDTQLKPGMVLRVLYMLRGQGDGSSDLELAHKGDADEAYSRASNSAGSEQKMPSAMAHEIEGYRRTIWQVPYNFVLAMAQYPTDSMHLIYSTTGRDRGSDLVDERFSFFDGLFVGLPEGKVTVLAVENESKARQAGLVAGDEILAVGGNSTHNDLATFSAAYAAAKKAAKDNEASSYTLSVRSAKGETRSANVPMPTRIKSGLMDGF